MEDFQPPKARRSEELQVQFHMVVAAGSLGPDLEDEGWEGGPAGDEETHASLRAKAKQRKEVRRPRNDYLSTGHPGPGGVALNGRGLQRAGLAVVSRPYVESQLPPDPPESDPSSPRSPDPPWEARTRRWRHCYHCSVSVSPP